jgi:hypothetical protein
MSIEALEAQFAAAGLALLKATRAAAATIPTETAGVWVTVGSRPGLADIAGRVRALVRDAEEAGIVVLDADVVVGDVSDRLLVAAKMLRDALEGVAQGLLLDVRQAALGHPALRVDTFQGLQESAIAVPALVALYPRLNAGRPATYRAIQDGQRPWAVLVQSSNQPAQLTGVGLLGVLGCDDKALAVVDGAQYHPARKLKNVSHSSVRGVAFFGGLPCWISFRTQSRPNSSIFAHCSADSRIERCTSFSWSASFGRPPGFVGFVSMSWIVHEEKESQKLLAIDRLLNHNNYINPKENNMAIEGTKFTVCGTSDYPICDCCGKTNLTRAVVVKNEFAEEFNVGCICASKVLRQRYQGKNHRVSTAAVISMGKAAKSSKEWQERNGYHAQSFQLVAA